MLGPRTTRLIAEGFHFINGVIYDLHPDHPRQQSVLVIQTSLFRLARLYVRGPKAGTSEVVLDGLTGTPDGMDRDAQGRLWLAMILERGKLLTWLHKNAWLKPPFMRLPARLLLRQQPRGGPALSSSVLTAFSPSTLPSTKGPGCRPSRPGAAST